MDPLKRLDAAIANLALARGATVHARLDRQRDARLRRELLQADAEKKLAQVDAARADLGRLVARRDALKKAGAESERATMELRFLEREVGRQFEHVSKLGERVHEDLVRLRKQIERLVAIEAGLAADDEALPCLP